MEEWLIRTHENKIIGPFSKDHVCALIMKGELQIEDEICRGNSYWFSLHEYDEVKKQLGIELPKSIYRIDDQEVTETETETVEVHESVRRDSKPFVEAFEAVEAVEQTMVLSTRSQEDVKPILEQVKPVLTSRPSVEVRGSFSSIEPTSYWRGLAWLLAVAVVVVTFIMLRVMRA